MNRPGAWRTWRPALAPLLVAATSVVTLVLADPGAAPHPVNPAQLSFPRSIQLELPEYGTDRFPPGILRIPHPETIQRVVLHIPKSRIHRATPKINTLGTGVVQHVRALSSETIYDIDLSLHQAAHYSFGPEANTVEIKVIERPGALPVYARWVVLPPEEESWVTRSPLSGSESEAAPGPGNGEARAVAALSGDGVEILQELRDGTLAPLEDGWTTARRILVRAGMSRKEEAVSLRIRHGGEDGSSKTTSAGASSLEGPAPPPSRGVEVPVRKDAALEAPIDLQLGVNHLEVEILHGYEVLSRTLYRIVRRTPTDPREIAGEKWAVVIGISDYQAQIRDLDYPHEDARALAAFLERGAGFSRDRIRLLTDGEATHQAIRSTFFSFLAGTRPDDLVVLFLAGHGVQDKRNPDNFYFLAHDSDLEDLGGTAIPMWELGNVMNHSVKARHIVVMADTCHSGDASRHAGVNDGTGLSFFNKYLETLAATRGRLVLTASQAHESSLELHRYGHGVFTHFLLQGLEGQADDNPADRTVTAGELMDFLRRAVPKATSGEQHPSFRDVGFDLNLPLSHLPREEAAAR